jgi:hypothetical protein
MEEYNKKHPHDFKSSSSNKDNEDLEDEGFNEEESSGSHGSGFTRLGKEHEEEEKKRKLIGKATGSSQGDDLEDMDGIEFDMSQTAMEENHDAQGDKNGSLDEEMIDDESILEKEKEEMKMIDQKFEEKTKKLAQMISIQQGGLL